jgi:hypothetical protein
MANSIDELKGMVSNKGGIARGNVYRVFFPAITGATSSEVNLLCTGVNIPGRQIMTQERKIGIINQKVAYDQAYDDVQLTFLLLNDYGIRQYFESWQNLCVNQETQELGYLNEYTFDVKIQQLTKGFDIPIYSTDLGLPTIPPLIQNRLPKVGPLDLAQGTLDFSAVGGNQITYECTLMGAFPTTLNIIELGNSREDVMELSVQLSYRNWKSGFTPKSEFGSNLVDRITDRIL